MDLWSVRMPFRRDDKCEQNGTQSSCTAGAFFAAILLPHFYIEDSRNYWLVGSLLSFREACQCLVLFLVKGMLYFDTGNADSKKILFLCEGAAGYNPATKISYLKSAGDVCRGTFAREYTMSDGAVVGGQGAGLSEVERVVDTFVAPSKTFTDILRSTSWWLPFLLLVVVSFGTTVVVEKQVGLGAGRGEPDPSESEAGREDGGFVGRAEEPNQMRDDGGDLSLLKLRIVCVHPGVRCDFRADLLGELQFRAGSEHDVRADVRGVYVCFAAEAADRALLTIVTLLFGSSPESYRHAESRGDESGLLHAGCGACVEGGSRLL